MNIINIFDTSIGTQNIGDEIIVDAVRNELGGIFYKDTMFVNSPTHERIGKNTYRLIKSSKVTFVAGTNLLNSKYRLIRSNSWKISFVDAYNFRNVVLMGVGWGTYQKKPSFLSKALYKTALSKEYIHSVRDNYTKNKLESIGIKNVINTGCPTMWMLTPEFCENIPTRKAKNVIMTLTDYAKDIEKDAELIKILQKNYDRVYCWIQGSNDAEYLNSITQDLEVINPTLKAFDDILESEEDLDYVGTRLHAGIRAMQKKRRSIIIGIDNRALEKQKDFNINVINRDEMYKLEDYINKDIKTELSIDFSKISDWKSQFV